MHGFLEPIFANFIRDEIEIILIWEKARKLPGLDPAEYRLDIKGNLIKFTDHGKRVSTGWEKDHIIPRALGGSDHVSNLQPLQWRENRIKGDRLCG